MKIAGMRSTILGLTRVLVLVTGLVSAAPILAANYPLELVSPRAVGTAPATGNEPITLANRIFKAYPGLEYNIRAVVVGGAYPYSFSLSNAPDGMTIDERTGAIVWQNPQSSATPTITVTDSEGTRASSSWVINVTTSGFWFIDAVNGRSQPAGTGSARNPWRTISDMVNSPSAAAGDIVYFHTGVYTALDLPRESVGSAWERVVFSASRKPVVWIAYPGDRPIIDFGFTPGVDPGVIFRFMGGNIYLDGFEGRNVRVIGFQLTSGNGQHYRTLRRLRMHDLNMIRANLDGSNAGFVMTTSSYSNSDAGGNPSTWSQYMAIQDCEFYNAPADLAIKTYSNWKMVIEDNVFRDLYFATELKSDMPQFSYRGNRHIRIPGRAIGGNMDGATTHGEILFNLVNEPTGQFSLDVNQDGHAKRIDVYRNTFVGRVRVRNVDMIDGPFVFHNNVIVNSDIGVPSGSHIIHEEVSAPTRVSITDNLVGYPNTNVVDSLGSLTGEYRRYLGTHGHESEANGDRPLPPSNLIVE